MRLLELTLIRVGNDEYARLNRSFGLTTMRDRHARVEGAGIRFRFPGKSGKRHEVGLRGPAPRRASSGAARTCPARSCSSTSTPTASVHDVTSDDVNEYLREITRRGLHGQGLPHLGRDGPGVPRAAGAAPAGGTRPTPATTSPQPCAITADRLGNTPAVARNSYVHPAVIDAYLDGSIGDALVEATEDAGEAAAAATDEETDALVTLVGDGLAAEQAAPTEAASSRRSR